MLATLALHPFALRALIALQARIAALASEALLALLAALPSGPRIAILAILQLGKALADLPLQAQILLGRIGEHRLPQLQQLGLQLQDCGLRLRLDQLALAGPLLALGVERFAERLAPCIKQ